MLSCYFLVPPEDAEPPDLAAFVREGAAGSFERHNLPTAREDFDAALFVPPSNRRQPAWAGFLEQGFPDLDLADQRSVGALLVVRRSVGGESFYLGFAFGTTGRFLLRSERRLPGFGMRAALNAICGDGSTDLVPQIRSFDAKRFQETTLHRRHQSSQSVPIETLDVDTARDLMRSVHGTPADGDAWGTRIGGTHALAITKQIAFDDLPSLCDDIIALAGRTDYLRSFEWVDHVAPVETAAEKAAVEEHVLELLLKRETAKLSFGPPQIIDWSSVRGFGFTFERSKEPVLRPELDIEFLVAALAKLREVSVARLKTMEVRAQDEHGEVVYRWPIWDCLSATVELDGRTFVLDDGDVFAVDTAYARRLDDDLDRVPAWGVPMPSANNGEAEDAYLDRMTVAVAGMHNVHATSKVRVPSQTAPIELCDAFHEGRKAFVHVKRDFKSKALSHLLAQGLVSAELMVRSVEFREAVKASGRAYLPMDSFNGADHEVVYAIIGRWKGQSLSQRLPFFSKIQARRTFDELEAMGYGVAYTPVDIG